MTDFVILGIMAILGVSGMIHTIKHFKGNSGCCGGGSYKPRKKKLARILYKKTFIVSGMHCEHCRNRVMEAVNDIDGVSGVVNLKKGEVTVSYAADVPDEVIRAEIERAGYKAV